MRLALLLTGVIAILAPIFGADFGSVCIAPVTWRPLPYSAPGLYCDSDKVSLRIDGHAAAAPVTKNVKIGQLDATSRHRVVILCDGKPQQSFTFRFSEFTSNDLCLYINDLYKTAQIREAKVRPWCKCK